MGPIDETSRDVIRAFERLVEDPDFATAVVEDPAGALAGYDLSTEETEALTSDAAALESEVQGFSHRTMAATLGLGGLRTPALFRPQNTFISSTGPITDTVGL